MNTEPQNNDPWRQHVVSQVVLRRWTTDGQLVAHDLLRNSTRLRSPRSEGFVRNLVAAGSRQTEEVWREIEDRAEPALDQLEAGTLLSDADSIIAIKDLMALHMVRSKALAAMWTNLLGQNQRVADLRQLFLRPEVLDAVFTELTGFAPAGPGARLHALEHLSREFERRLGPGGTGFRDAMLEHLDGARLRVSAMFLDIGIATDGEFVIGDAPMQTADSQSRRAGYLAGVSWADADYLGMPLGPRVTIGLAKRGPDRVTEVQARGVEQLNQIQLATAHWKAYYLPGSPAAEQVANEVQARSVRFGTAAHPDSAGDHP